MEPRLPDNERDPNGMLESNRDFIFHNSEWLEWCEKHSDLIALAPEMAEALESFITLYNQGQLQLEGDNGNDPVIVNARALLARL